MQNIYAMFEDLECTAMNCHADSAAIHRRRVCHAFLDVKRKESTPAMQLQITEVLSDKS